MAFRYNGKGKNRKSKYGANKAVVDGIVFDSRKEARRYTVLKAMQDAGEICDLQLQVKYLLIPSQREPDREGPKGGHIKGRIIERECAYFADFVYRIPGTETVVVEDTKGMKTPEYVIKRKLMLYVHGIQIKEI